MWIDRRTTLVCAAAAMGLSASLAAHGAQATRPVTGRAPSTTRAAGTRLVVTVVEVVGNVQVRLHENAKWELAREEMRLDEGAEFRTGPKSRVVFTIPPDQRITLDRLGTVKVLQAVQEVGRVRTDLGMKYGRTVYEVEEAGIEHDATIRAPGMTLAVRGTDYMSLQDQGAFPTIAVANQPVRAQKRNRSIPFGKEGQRAKLRGDTDSPGETALDESTVDPAGRFSGRTENENAILAYLQQVSPGLNTNRFPLLRTLTDPNFEGSGGAVLPIPGQLEFTLIWTSGSASNVDLLIRSPLGEVLSPRNTAVGSSGRHLGDGRSDGESLGQESAVWEQGYPRGEYRITARWRSGGTSNATFQVVRDPLTAGENLGVFTGTVSAKNPRQVQTVTIDPPKSGDKTALAKRKR